MKRLGALVLAVAMVVGALYLRGRITDDGADASDPARTLRLRCSAELEPVCATLAAASDGVEVSAEPAGTTADRLRELEGGDPDFDVWLTDATWPAIVEDNRRVDRAGGSALGGPSPVLGRSPVALVVHEGRRAALEGACGGPATWSCVGEQAESGTAVGLPSPERGDGLAVLASAVGGRLGTTDYAANDFDAPEFDRWFSELTRLSKQVALGGRLPLERAVAATGTFVVVGALESQYLALSRERGGLPFTAIYPEPVVTSDVVLVPSDLTDLDAALDRIGGTDAIAAALAANGWRVGGELPDDADGSVQLPEESNMPKPGVLQALRERW